MTTQEKDKLILDILNTLKKEMVKDSKSEEEYYNLRNIIILKHAD